MARAGAFPAWLAQRSSRDTPVNALLLTGVLVSTVVLLNAEKNMVDIFTFLLLISTSAILVMYLLSAAGALLLYKRGELLLKHSMTGFLTVAAAACVYALWALLGAGTEAVLWGFFLLASGLPVYYFSRGERKRALLSLPLLAIVPVWHVITHFRM
jgi:APA family basic amino acid/polyamine antiporter